MALHTQMVKSTPISNDMPLILGGREWINFPYFGRPIVEAQVCPALGINLMSVPEVSIHDRAGEARVSFPFHQEAEGGNAGANRVSAAILGVGEYQNAKGERFRTYETELCVVIGCEAFLTGFSLFAEAGSSRSLIVDPYLWPLETQFDAQLEYACGEPEHILMDMLARRH